MRILLLLFVILPIAEIFVLIKVGTAIGTMSTIALILLTAFIGAGLLKQQGYSTLERARSKMNQGALPAHEMVEGIFLAVGGALLLTPGFITDAIGFCCLVPGLRHYIIVAGQKYIRPVQMHSQFYGASKERAQTHSKERVKSSKKDESTVIDGEFERED